MNCIDCRHCAANNIVKNNDQVCCNKKSPHYNKIMSWDTAAETTCEYAESQEAYDYRTMNPWQFASKYYM